MNGLSHRTWLHCSVQESWWKVPLVLNVREKSSTLTLDGSAVAHLGQYGTGVHMKITDEMVPCPVCGWMRNHTFLSWSKWARLLTCWNNHSESESLWRLWFFFFFHRTVLMYYNHPLPFNEKKRQEKNKVELLLTITFSPHFCVWFWEISMRGDWIEKGRGKVQRKTPDGGNIAWWQIRKRKKKKEKKKEMHQS